ncbi:MAG: CFI-box-CTERM domain-containing protein, partial [Polyangiales bacterium]
STPKPNPAALAAARVLEFHFTPVHNAQLALWIEDNAGHFLATVALTEAVSARGIGNRPGASQMNSGFRWPYGRREGVLPVWAHRRQNAPGAKPFRRVIFQNRTSEGRASRTNPDHSRDDYFCLSFNRAAGTKDALDAVSCASVFTSDKGRFITEDDVALGYAEPYEDPLTHAGIMQPLSLHSLYPPRRDVSPCATGGDCNDHLDVAQFDSHTREVMPDIDAVSMATPKGDDPQQRLFSVPEAWAGGEYRACLEINVEGDHNGAYDEAHFPTPLTPEAAWDDWARDYGYPYRGQPSVVYCLPFALQSETEATFHTDQPEGSPGHWDTSAPGYGALTGMLGMTDDPINAPGSGADRLRRDAAGDRLVVLVKPAVTCASNAAPSGVDELALWQHPDDRRAHEWLELSFRAAGDDRGIFSYDVRVSDKPIVDDTSFMRGQPAKAASTAAEQLFVPASQPAGAPVQVALGGLTAETRYFVGVRAIDGCAMTGPISVAEFTTPKRIFATVTPCFVATAAYGTPLAAEIGALRRFRDRHLASHALGRAWVAAYHRYGPWLAERVRDDERLRAAARTLLAPAVAAARLLDN